jgi:hypothetical protein
VAAEYLRPFNQGLTGIGSAVNFQHFVESTYLITVLPLIVSNTQSRSTGVIKNYLLPAFGKMSLRELTPLAVQEFFACFRATKLQHEPVDKIRDVLA